MMRPLSEERNLYKGVVIMLLSSNLTCFGQLLWKLSSKENSVLLILYGFVLYGMGAIFMIIALRFGELSVLHPMLSFGFILSLGLGALVLGEKITFNKIFGVAFIILGLITLSYKSKSVAEK